MFIKCFRYNYRHVDTIDPDSAIVYEPDFDDIVYVECSSIIFIDPINNDNDLAFVSTVDNFTFITEDLNKVLSHFYLEF